MASRTLLKTCTYAVMHLTVAIVVAFVLTRDWRIALAVGLVEPIVQTIAFALHERFWAKAGDVRPQAFCGHGHGVLSAEPIPRADAWPPR